MASTRDERPPVSWADLLAAINPPKKTPEELYERALDGIIAAWQEGKLTDAEADELVQELISARIHYEMRGIINDALSPDMGRLAGSDRRRRFSLI